MRRSKLRNKFLKTRNNTDKFNYKKLLCIKLCFSDKSENSERIALTENDEIGTEDSKVALSTRFFKI